MAGSARTVFGEIAIWESKPRQASARCLEATKLLYVPRDYFEHFINLMPDMHAIFAVWNALRAQENVAAVVERRKTISPFLRTKLLAAPMAAALHSKLSHRESG